MVRVEHSRQALHARGVSLAAMLLVTLAGGCKSGSWNAKPSWWGFGGTPETSSLAAAPSFDKDVTKPSETAKPYPTTSTPEGYALSDATATNAARTEGGGTPSIVAPSSVTYGATPPPAAASQPAPAATVAAAPSSIGPQVGPYAGIQPQATTPPPPTAVDPAAAATAGLAAAPAFGDAQPPAAQPPAARYADARAAESWATSPPPVAPPSSPQTAAPPMVTGDSRYEQTTGSRFGTPTSFEPSAPAPAAPAPAATPAPAPAVSAPAASAPASFAPPSATGSDQLPGGISPPKRRPDPGYRPAGTSSYRPSRTILAGDEPPAAGVLPASFEAPPTSP